MSQETYPNPHPLAGARRSLGVAALAVLILALGLGYALHERTVARQLAAQNDQIASALKQNQSQIEALTARLNEAAASPAEAPVVHSVRRPRPAAVRRRADDPRWKQLQEQLAKHQQEIDEAQKNLASTQQDLSSAKTELSGSIARTHDDLVALQRKGERNYYEFDLYKSKQYHATGPVSVKLRKANTKHQYADLELMVDDASLQQKHVNLYQPIMFYPQDSAQPLELVINNIGKDHIHGYVSAPKYKASELSAMGSASAAATTAATTDNPGTAAGQANTTASGLKLRPRPNGQ